MIETDNGLQLDLFDVLYDDFKFDNSKPVRLVEMFAGVGTQRMGFERQGIDVEVIAIVEVDKWAVLSYAAMHTDYLKIRMGWFEDKDLSKEDMINYLQTKNVGYDFKNNKHTITDRNNIEIVRDFYLACILSNNLGDISKVKGSDLPNDIDMLTYSFPCTDLSKAGQQKGLSETRSGLVYQVFRIVEELKRVNNMPKTLLMENVVDLIQKKFIDEFREMQIEVESYGYMNYTMVMSAKDYGVAQSRDRVFMLSTPKEKNYNEPHPFKLEKRLKDYLEDDVDESFYLSETFKNGMGNSSTKGFNRSERFRQCIKTRDERVTSNTITTREGRVATCTYVSDQTICLNPKVDGKQPSLQDRVYSEDGIMPAITTGFHPSVATDDVSGTYIGTSEAFTRKPTKGLARTLLTRGNGAIQYPNLRIRKLTPLECWRLMGIDDEYFYKAQQVNSNAQLYKQAGNAIVVDVFGHIVKQLI